MELQLQLLAERVGGRRPEAAAQTGGAAQQALEEVQIVQRGGARGLCQARGRVRIQLPREISSTPGAAAQTEGSQGGPRAQRPLHAQYHPGPISSRVGRCPLGKEQIRRRQVPPCLGLGTGPGGSKSNCQQCCKQLQHAYRHHLLRPNPIARHPPPRPEPHPLEAPPNSRPRVKPRLSSWVLFVQEACLDSAPQRNPVRKSEPSLRALSSYAQWPGSTEAPPIDFYARALPSWAAGRWGGEVLSWRMLRRPGRPREFVKTKFS